MSNANGIIAAPVSLDADVAPVLGSNNPDLGSLCTHSNINMWSKVKPVKSSAKVREPAAVAALMKSCDYGMVADDDGLSIFGSGVHDFVMRSYFSGGRWHYERPDSRYRTLDFHGYNHNTPQVPPADVNFVYTNTTEERDLLQVLFTVNENTPIQLRDFTALQYYGTPDVGQFRYVLVIDKTGEQGSVLSDYDVIIGSPLYADPQFTYYHRNTPGPNVVIEKSMADYPVASMMVAAGIMLLTQTSTGWSYGTWAVLPGGFYRYQRTSPVGAVSLELRNRGYGEDGQGISEMRYSIQALAGYTLTDLNVVVEFFHEATGGSSFYMAGGSEASPTTGGYITVDVSSAPTRVQGTDYATVMYTYREDGTLKQYYYDFRNNLVSDQPYPRQQLM